MFAELVRLATVCLLLLSLILCRCSAVKVMSTTRRPLTRSTTTKSTSTTSSFGLTGDIHTGGSRVKLCYYDNQAALLTGDGKFKVDNIDPFICTHIVYSSIGVAEDATLKHRMPFESYFEDYSGLMRLKRLNRHLHVMVSLKFEKLYNVFDNIYRKKKLINETLSFLETYELDGVDIAWPERSMSYKPRLVEFMRDLRHEIGYKRVISLTVFGDSHQEVYDFPKLNRYVNYYNLIAFNLNDFGAYETSFRMPLNNTHPENRDIWHSRQIDTVEQIVNHMIDRGAESERILLGVSLHARTFILASASNTDLHAPVIGLGHKGVLTNRTGSLSYTEVCMKLAEGGWTTVYNEEIGAVYAYRRVEWMTYETPRTMKRKQRFAAKLHLGGLMVWSIDADDMSYVCGPNKNMLLDVLWVDDWKPSTKIH